MIWERESDSTQKEGVLRHLIRRAGPFPRRRQSCQLRLERLTWPKADLGPVHIAGLTRALRHKCGPGYASFTWRTIDGELAGLTYDSCIEEPSRSGVRSQQTGLRAMTFASSSLTIEIEVTSTSLMGQLVPAHTGEVLLSFQDGTGRRVPVDELGAFTIDPISEDRFRLQVAGEPQVTTDWIVL